MIICHKTLKDFVIGGMERCLLLIFIFLAGLNSEASETMNLAAFLNKVGEQNLDLKVESAKRDALEAKSVGLAIPPPMVSVNQMNMATGDTARGFEVNQTIPFPTKLTGDHSARSYAAKSQRACPSFS